MRLHSHLQNQKNGTTDSLHIHCIFITALLLRIISAWYLLGLDWHYNTGDGYENSVFLDHLLAKNCYMPPLQYLFTGLINNFFAQPNYLLLRIATIVISSLTCTNMFRIGKENFDRSTGLVAGYGSAFSLSFIFHSWTFYPTTLAACVFSFFALHFLRALHQPTPQNILYSGILIGLSALTRAEMLALLPISVLWLLLVRGASKASLKHISGIILVSSLLIGSWTARNYIVCNEFTVISSNGPVNFYIGNNPLQTGGYSTPIASQAERARYFTTGLKYTLEHPGWFCRFFKNKLYLFFSSETWEHPAHMLKTKFDRSTVKEFNSKFADSRLGMWLQSNSKTHSAVLSIYSCFIILFWSLVLAGLLYGTLFWRQSYFLVLLCAISALIFSLFFSGSHRLMMPVLTLLYILMALGATALTKIWFLRPALIKQLIYRNGLICSIMLGCYACSSLLTYSPSTKTETISRLHQWNIIRTTKKNISLLIMESELAYPIADNTQNREACTIRYNGTQNAQSHTANDLSDIDFLFLPTKSLLCKQGILIDLPVALQEKYFQEKKGSGSRVASQNLFASLKSKISIQYTPAWQFRPWIETFFGHLAKRL